MKFIKGRIYKRVFDSNSKHHLAVKCTKSSNGLAGVVVSSSRHSLPVGYVSYWNGNVFELDKESRFKRLIKLYELQKLRSEDR